MATATPRSCRVGQCDQEVPEALAADSLCLDHFLDQSFVRADLAFEKCIRGETIDSGTLDWLLDDAHATVKALADNAAKNDLAQQSKILELLLCIANLNDYVAHHSVHATRKT
ncbi:MAG: hypothetical protein WCA98_00450 [Candidatus Acidiferrales bacterium]